MEQQGVWSVVGRMTTWEDCASVVFRVDAIYMHAKSVVLGSPVAGRLLDKREIPIRDIPSPFGKDQNLKVWKKLETICVLLLCYIVQWKKHTFPQSHWNVVWCLGLARYKNNNEDMEILFKTGSLKTSHQTKNNLLSQKLVAICPKKKASKRSQYLLF